MSRYTRIMFALGLAACSGGSSTEATTKAAESELSSAPAIHRVALSTGVEISYLEQGNQRGDNLIFLHGYTDSYHSFDRNLPILSRRHHVYALDQRGHGDSDKPACCYAPGD